MLLGNKCDLRMEKQGKEGTCVDYLRAKVNLDIHHDLSSSLLLSPFHSPTTGPNHILVQEFADVQSIPLFEVSAKDGTNVELAFTEMAAIAWTKLIQTHQNNDEIKEE